jgi:lipoyl synthase
MIRLSAGTAASMGLTAMRMDAYPTTAYLLSGNQCLMKCAFCPQGVGGNEALNRLGRITWPEYSWDDFAGSLERAERNGIRRICLQSVRHADGIATLVDAVKRIKSFSSLPLSLSAWIRSAEEAAALVEAGVDRLSVSLDVVNPQAHEKFKGSSLQDRLDLLLGCAERLPGRMSTHIICGLGETEEETLAIINLLLKAEVTVALFAFVPLKGTALEKAESPPIASYRRVQAGHYLLRKKAAELAAFKFEAGRLTSFGLSSEKLEHILGDGNAFQTSGCPDCNRPYYNERPGGIIYNYHRPLSEGERKTALKELIRQGDKGTGYLSHF